MGIQFQRLAKGYYIANALLLGSYAVIRQYFYSQTHLPYTRLHSHSELEQWERQVLGLLLVTVVVKYVRSQSMEAFMSSLFLYGKTAMAVLTFLIDLRIFAYYAILNLLIFITCPQPEYQGPDKIERLTPGMLRQHIADSKTSGVTWLVEFYTAWSPASVHLDPVFAEISMRYKTETLRFAKLDLSRWSGIAKEHKINLNGASPQVPSFILFEKGEEVARIPHIYSDGSVAKGKYRKGDIIKAFDLDIRYATSLNKSSKSKPSSLKKAS